MLGMGRSASSARAAAFEGVGARSDTSRALVAVCACNNLAAYVDADAMRDDPSAKAYAVLPRPTLQASAPVAARP